MARFVQLYNLRKTFREVEMSRLSRIVVLAAVVAVALAITSGSVYAATATDTLTVSATVSDQCRVKSVTDINFGVYDPTEETTPTDADGDFTFKCTKDTGYDLYITGARSMTDGTNTISYELYTNSGRTTAWSTTSPGVTGTSASNADDTRGIYGRITPAQDVPAGSYSGTVTITVEY